MELTMRTFRCGKRVLALGISFCLGLGPVAPGIAVACEGEGKGVTVTPKQINFGKVPKTKPSERILTYKNNGPGAWQLPTFKFFATEGALGVWGNKEGKKPCLNVLPAETCEEIVTFQPSEAKRFQAELTTSPVSETVLLEGEG